MFVSPIIEMGGEEGWVDSESLELVELILPHSLGMDHNDSCVVSHLAIVSYILQGTNQIV